MMPVPVGEKLRVELGGAPETLLWTRRAWLTVFRARLY